MKNYTYDCDFCKTNTESIFYVLVTDKAGSKFVILCGACKESIQKHPNKYFTIKVFNDTDLRQSFE
jgi:transcription elongation factor Elf1